MRWELGWKGCGKREEEYLERIKYAADENIWAALNNEGLRADEGEIMCEWSSAGIQRGVNGRSPRNPAGQRHRQARFPLGKIRTYGVAPECKGGGNGRSPRKPVDQWHCPARFPHVKIRERPRWNKPSSPRWQTSAQPVFANYSPPNKANQVRFPYGVALRIFACGNRAGRCRWLAGFLEDPPFPPPLHSDAAPYSHHSTSSALKTSLLRTAQISSLTHSNQDKNKIKGDKSPSPSKATEGRYRKLGEREDPSSDFQHPTPNNTFSGVQHHGWKHNGPNMYAAITERCTCVTDYRRRPAIKQSDTPHHYFLCFCLAAFNNKVSIRTPAIPSPGMTKLIMEPGKEHRT
ncbi:hypothetical protein PR048_015291 [Dryococelus australis]|uniref:Uncharacterized protein n=1 Tax=Dryococelus australis TaxID=614101 RepID=A0ABQ9HHJ5_9NEOP|nr:hypothetical protein PR048_015291 [Dryococelus australis]